MPIAHRHPVLEKLDRECPYECRLIGSRYVGKHDPENSDYDFIVTIPGDYSAQYKGSDWFKANGFVANFEGYGPDPGLIPGGVLTCRTPGLPDVDVLLCTPTEAAFRLGFIEAMHTVAPVRAGLIALGLKKSEGWGIFWDVLRSYVAGKAEPGPNESQA